jgi:hypothetical protein
MRVIAMRPLTVRGLKVEQGEEFDLPPSLSRFVHLGWVRGVEEQPMMRTKGRPETRVEPKPTTRTKAKAKKGKRK